MLPAFYTGDFVTMWLTCICDAAQSACGKFDLFDGIHGTKVFQLESHIYFYREQLEAEKKEEIVNPSNFGEKYARHCICEIPGQVPCPSFVPLPEHMKGIKNPKKMNEEG